MVTEPVGEPTSWKVDLPGGLPRPLVRCEGTSREAGERKAVSAVVKLDELGDEDDELTTDSLTATWKIVQRRRGHRHSTDDLLTGWYALEKMPPRVDLALDLGAGIGSVGLIVLSGLEQHAKLTSVEAQEISYRLLKKNIAINRLEERVTPIHGDLRELDLAERFRLITGSPPYFDVAAGILPADSQKAHARFELRGDVRDYLRIASKHLDEGDGVFVFCFPFQQKRRALEAVRATSGLKLQTHRDVVPREGIEPLFSLFCCGRTGDEEAETPFVVRHADGRHTEMMHRVRARLGFAPQR